MRIDGIQRPKRLQGHIALLAIVLFVVACVPQTRWDYTPNKSHIVRSGETLFTIAFRYGHDHRELARWNNLGDGSLIYPGQVIRLTPEAGTSSARAPAGPAPTPRRTVPPPPSDPGQLLAMVDAFKIDCQILRAVARVTHSQQYSNGWGIGVQFVSLCFEQSRGSFITVRA